MLILPFVYANIYHIGLFFLVAALLEKNPSIVQATHSMCKVHFSNYYIYFVIQFGFPFLCIIYHFRHDKNCQYVKGLQLCLVIYILCLKFLITVYILIKCVWLITIPLVKVEFNFVKSNFKEMLKFSYDCEGSPNFRSSTTTVAIISQIMLVLSYH